MITARLDRERIYTQLRNRLMRSCVICCPLDAGRSMRRGADDVIHAAEETAAEASVLVIGIFRGGRMTILEH